MHGVCVRVFVCSCVYACVRACVRVLVCVYACVFACVRVIITVLSTVLSFFNFHLQLPPFFSGLFVESTGRSVFLEYATILLIRRL